MKLSGHHKAGFQKHHFSLVLPSYSLLTALPLQHPWDAADLIALLSPGLGQGEHPWDLGAHRQEIPQLSPTPGQGTAGLSHEH